MSLFKSFATDKALEKNGVIFTPDSSTAITLARAGGANIRYQKLLTAKAKPFKRQIDSETMDPDVERKILMEAYAETVVKNWETLIGEGDEAQLVQGIEPHPDHLSKYQGEQDENGLVPFNKHNVYVTFELLPDLFLDCQAEAQRFANYRAKEREEDAGN